MNNNNRTIFDLNEEEFETYENNPEIYEDITENSIQDAINMMYDSDEYNKNQLEDISKLTSKAVSN